MAHDQAPTILVVADDAPIQDVPHETQVDGRYRMLPAADGPSGFRLAIDVHMLSDFVGHPAERTCPMVAGFTAADGTG
jgi:hypothetical protein